MKLIFTLSIVAAVVAVAYGSPANVVQVAPNQAAITLKTADFFEAKADPVIDWARAEVLGNNFRNVYNNSLSTVAKIALEADPEVGQGIEDAANFNGKEIDKEMTPMLNDIKNQRLTADDLRGYVGVTFMRFNDAQLMMIPIFEYLPEDTEKSIRAILKETGPSAGVVLKELLPMFGIDWRHL